MESNFMLVSWGFDYGCPLFTSSFSLKVTSRTSNFPSSSMTSKGLSKDENFNLLGLNGVVTSESCIPFFFGLTRVPPPSQLFTENYVIGKIQDPIPCWWCVEINVLESSVNVVNDPTFVFCSAEFLCGTIAKTQSNIDVMKIFLLKQKKFSQQIPGAYSILILLVELSFGLCKDSIIGRSRKYRNCKSQKRSVSPVWGGLP